MLLPFDPRGAIDEGANFDTGMLGVAKIDVHVTVLIFISTSAATHIARQKLAKSWENWIVHQCYRNCPVVSISLGLHFPVL